MSNEMNAGCFNPEAVRQMGYDAATNYTDELNQYNASIAAHDKEAARDILRRHGGLIALCVKCGYQQQTQGAKQ